MNHAIQIIPTHQGVGLTSCIIGLFQAFHRCGVKTAYYKPVSQIDSHALGIIQKQINVEFPAPIEAKQADLLLSQGKSDVLLEKIIITCEQLKNDNQIVIIGGLLETKQQPYATELNRMIAKAVDADIILATDTIGAEDLPRFEHKLEFAAASFGGTQSERVLGTIINRINSTNSLTLDTINSSKLFTQHFKQLAAIPINEKLTYPRTLDVIRFLDGRILNWGEADTRRISDYVLIARTIPNAIEFLTAGALVITPSDRDDVIMATSLAAASGHQIAGLVLTGTTEPTSEVMQLCQPHIEQSGLPVIRIDISSWQIAKKMDEFNLHIPIDDTVRIHRTMDYFADQIDSGWCQTYIDSEIAIRLSPAAFKYQMVRRAQQAQKCIILPEGDEPRTVVAANTCAQRGIAECILLAEPDDVKAIAENRGITLHANLKVVAPDAIREHYIARLIELRKHKGMNETLARAQLQDNVMLATMMLEAREVDGLVSGAVHTTASTIRPPLQIIKTAPDCKLVSSVFFMCLPEQVLVYGDCAINPNPDAGQLAEIAIQSADSAKAFGIEPKVAMVSYSTGTSGSGEDVEKVREATTLVKLKRPDIVIDGPLQYDAAAIPSVAVKKAPTSPVAGKANVFIFPDLNTGNTTYKAVQRAANAISIGPMLQGMRMPVNDLSRGASVDDIIYTIAITAIQASEASYADADK
ncbi:MAG: phosphate acetyltransferase [Gammaproteobacteria bacterium]|nr:MAG: phosphate acetyltransferase [Gammaproteobacteria bacterium]